MIQKCKFSSQCCRWHQKRPRWFGSGPVAKASLGVLVCRAARAHPSCRKPEGGGAGYRGSTCRRLGESHLDHEDLISKELEDKTRPLKRNILASPLKRETDLKSLAPFARSSSVMIVLRNPSSKIKRKKNILPYLVNCTKTYDLLFE